MEPDRNRLRGVQPYPPGTQWYFRGQGGHEKTEELALWWDPAGSIVSDDYLPEDTSAAELWGIWAKDCNRYHERYPQRYRPGEIPIVWTVTPVSEMAPHTFDPRDLVESPFGSMPREDFLTFYTHPVHVDTGERLNWLRLPVVNKA
ncbi:hypothetical protein ACFWII_34085 [Streptomyces sp. NPDC127063]|uniref:hypothetical protein n=1 Tax=Streptomyces sp. NPDC127063 TaxID=3347123 RepID=UPI00365F82BD